MATVVIDGEAWTLSDAATKALMAVLHERGKQRQRWTVEEDDAHSAVEWVALLAKQMGQLAEAANRQHYTGGGSPNQVAFLWGDVAYEATQVAAVALALYEAVARRW